MEMLQPLRHQFQSWHIEATKKKVTVIHYKHRSHDTLQGDAPFLIALHKGILTGTCFALRTHRWACQCMLHNGNCFSFLKKLLQGRPEADHCLWWGPDNSFLMHHSAAESVSKAAVYLSCTWFAKILHTFKEWKSTRKLSEIKLLISCLPHRHFPFHASQSKQQFFSSNQITTFVRGFQFFIELMLIIPTVAFGRQGETTMQ